MKNYVIINGVNSLTITGLAISKLPSISKPPLRVMTEEINGRDGDLITELGYGAYDKELVIGLYGNYDINEVIGFFNQEGTIVFSNEDDKYYNFKIINQIDYEALIKFRTATISLHCQPFKYPLTETPEEITTEYVEDEGETITLNDTKIAPLEIDLKGNTSQTGTPTPSSPIDVNVVSGDNEVVVCGKNLFNGTNPIYVNDKILNDSGVEANDTSGGYTKMYIPVQPNTQYTISGVSSEGSKRIYFFNSTKAFISRSGTFGPSYSTFTTPSNCYYVDFQYYKRGNDFSTYMLCTGTSTDFVPYTSQNYPLYLGDIELCKIGDYQDYIYKDNGKWYLHKEVGKVVLNGSGVWSGPSVDGGTSGVSGRYYHTHNLTNFISSSSNDTMKNNLFPINGSTYGNDNTNLQLSSEYIMIRLKYSELNITTLADFKTWLSTHNVNVYYQLQTATDTEITDTNLLTQLENLKSATSYEGQTNISSGFMIVGASALGNL